MKDIEIEILAQTFLELRDATTELNRADEEARAASARLCTWRNNVNGLQKKLDGQLAEIKKSAPRDTDWKRTKGVPVPEVPRG